MRNLALAWGFSFLLLACGFSLLLLSTGTAADPKAPVAKAGPPNPAIDMAGYLRISQQAARHRAKRRLSEEEFLRMSREAGTIVLDARSRQKYELLHVRGAINLSFPDIDVDSLKRTLPDKSARILIYCNNNFRVDKAKIPVAALAFPPKTPTASLNLSTYIALYNYGYRNVYELGPQLDPGKTKLPLVPTSPKP
ncbi:MAG: rhodanese-like domain-containing protein [Gemmataceae bacterium]